MTSGKIVLCGFILFLACAVSGQRTTGNKQAFLFSALQDVDRWNSYRWDLISTVVIFDTPSPEIAPKLIDIAHQQGSSVQLVAGFPVAQLSNDTAKQEWIDKTVHSVLEFDADGVNLDTEDAIPKGSPDAGLLTQLVKDLGDQLRAANPNKYLQVTVDVAWSPDCIDVRCYDYNGLADVSDYFFIMMYDTRSQIFSKSCTAGPNSAMDIVEHGVKRFVEIGVKPEKLILGLPWYGYDYPCLNGEVDGKLPDVCEIKKIPFRGVECSDAAGSEHDYKWLIQNMTQSSVDGTHFDEDSVTPYFWYIAEDSEKTLHQVWYDDPISIKSKAEVAKKYNLAGTGMYTVDSIYGNPAFVSKEDIDKMWDALCPYQEARGAIEIA